MEFSGAIEKCCRFREIGVRPNCFFFCFQCLHILLLPNPTKYCHLFHQPPSYRLSQIRYQISVLLPVSILLLLLLPSPLPYSLLLRPHCLWLMFTMGTCSLFHHRFQDQWIRSILLANLDHRLFSELFLVIFKVRLWCIFLSYTFLYINFCWQNFCKYIIGELIEKI